MPPQEQLTAAAQRSLSQGTAAPQRSLSQGTATSVLTPRPAWEGQPLVLIPHVGHYQGECREVSGGVRRHGAGAQMWECGRSMGAVYAGEWKDDTAHGSGRLAMPSGLVVQGSWRLGRLHGWGCTVTGPDGSSFTGGFHKGLPHGPDCVWVRPQGHASPGRFRGRYDQGRALHGVVDGGVDVEWASTDEKQPWGWTTTIGIHELVGNPELEAQLNADQWVQQRAGELRMLWQKHPDIVRTIKDRYAFNPEDGEGPLPFTQDRLEALAEHMWDCVPSADLFQLTRTMAATAAKQRALLRSQAAQADTDFMALVLEADCSCELAGKNAFHAQKAQNVQKALAESQHPHFFRNVLMGRVAEVETDRKTTADLLLDLTAPPYKEGDMEYVARRPFQESIGVKKIVNGKLSPQKFVQRYCGHTVRPIKPRVEAAVQLPGGEQVNDEEMNEKKIEYRLHGGTGRGCPKIVSGGALHDLSDVCTHVPTFQADGDFNPVLLAGERWKQADYVLGPSQGDSQTLRPLKLKHRNSNSADSSSALAASELSFQVQTADENQASNPSRVSSRPHTSHKMAPAPMLNPWSTPKALNWDSDGLMLPGKSRGDGMIPEDSATTRVAVLKPIQTYLKRPTLHKASSSLGLTISSLGQVEYQSCDTPSVAWTHINNVIGYGNEGFKAMHACDSHELGVLPYSSGLIKVPPARPHLIEDIDQLVQVLGLREDNLGFLERIQSLNLSGHRVQALPPRIAMLRNLRELDASRNRLHSLPEEIRHLTSLTRLNLGRNPALMQDVPHSILSLAGIRELNLCNTGLLRLSDAISALRKLRVLDVSHNQLFSLPRKELVSMRALCTLICHGNPEINERVCGVPKEVAKHSGTTTLTRDGDKHPGISISDLWNWTPDGVLGFLRHRPHMFIPIREHEDKDGLITQSGGWRRSSDVVLLDRGGKNAVTDKATQLIDELLRLVIYMRRFAFPSAPGGPELSYKEVVGKSIGLDTKKGVKTGTKRKGKGRQGKSGKGGKGKGAKAETLIERYFVADRIHDIWETFQIDYGSNLTKCKPGHESVFLKHLMTAMNNTTLISARIDDLRRLLKSYHKRTAKDGFPFPSTYLDGISKRDNSNFPGKRDMAGGDFANTIRPPLSLAALSPEHSFEENIAESDANEDETGGDRGQMDEENAEEGGDDAEEIVKDEPPEDEEDEGAHQEKVHVDRMNVWEFHGVMFSALTEVRATGHIKGNDEESSQKRKGGKKKKKK